MKFNYILVYMPGLTLRDAPRLMLVGKASDAEVDEFKKWERQSHLKDK